MLQMMFQMVLQMTLQVYLMASYLQALYRSHVVCSIEITRCLHLGDSIKCGQVSSLLGWLQHCGQCVGNVACAVWTGV